MRCFLVLFFLFLTSFELLGCDASDSNVLHDSRGQLIAKESINGKWLVVNYWATWCHACMEEIPELNAFDRDYSSNKVVLLGANYDLLQGKSLTEAVEKARIKYPVVQENLDEYFTLGSIDVVPTTLIIDPKGHVVKRLLGPQTEAALSEALQGLTSEKA